MLYLNIPTDQDLDEYFQLVKDKILRNLQSLPANDLIRQYFTLEKLEEIIKGKPDELVVENHTLMNFLIPRYDDSEFKRFLDVQNDRTKLYANYDLINKYNIALGLYTVFDYDKIISKSKSTSYKLAQKLNRNTCTYCNRLYSNTVIVADSQTGGVNNKGRIARPQFDHWFSKSKHPALALSFYNLIPSCAVCNSSIKGDEDFSIDFHIHPYMKDQNEEFKFSFNYKDVHENNVKLIFPTNNSKIENTLKAFKIQEVYDVHSNFELRDLIELKYKYSEDYLDILLNKTFKDLGVGKVEAYRLIFGIEFNEDDFHKRPFSKFKKDIIEELLSINRT